MKVITDNLNATAFPLQWTCEGCESVLEVEEITDFTITQSDVTLNCPLCKFARGVPWMTLTRTDTRALNLLKDKRRAEMSLPYA